MREKTISVALAGNPNVGKSTVFNALTGLKQHTGNWAGKTVENAQGEFTYKGKDYIITDLPGTYSLMAHSEEETIARDFICFGGADMVVVVCDSTCLERNLNLALQAIEITDNVILCVNLMDEAEKKNIYIDLEKLEENLGIPVVATSARSEKGLGKLLDTMDLLAGGYKPKPVGIRYTEKIEQVISILQPVVAKTTDSKWNSRWISIKLMDFDNVLVNTLNEKLGFDIMEIADIKKALKTADAYINEQALTHEKFKDTVVSCIILTAEGICADSVFTKKCARTARDRKIDLIVTNKWTGIPIMLAILMGILWLTIQGANYPSELLSQGFGWLEERISEFAVYINMPDVVYGILVEGVYRVLTWVIAVMLPPMAIFFPLFTLLEDLGFLPRIAFNLDRFFKSANACGKQALTMCICKMGILDKTNLILICEVILCSIATKPLYICVCPKMTALRKVPVFPISASF